MMQIILSRIIQSAFCIIFLFGCTHPESRIDEEVPVSDIELGSETELETPSNSVEIEPIPLQIEPRTILEMETENGVRFVWIEINGVKLRFVFDTGASSICISPAEAMVMYRQGTLLKEDILDVQYYQDATGRISEGTKIILRTVKIGDIILENVEATIVNSVNAPLLLGQTVLERFGKIEIDNYRGEIVFK